VPSAVPAWPGCSAAVAACMTYRYAAESVDRANPQIRTSFEAEDADGGIDLVLSKGGEKFLVQCKQWRAFKVGVEVVRELYGVMAARGAAGGFVVTSGRFTDDAAAFASGRNVTLVDGPKLHAMIQQARAARSGTAPTTPTGRAPAAPAMASTAPGPSWVTPKLSGRIADIRGRQLPTQS
jgi:hypothetical protein